MVIQKNDFIALDYTLKLEDGTIFETTEEQVAKTAKIHDKKTKYDPRIIVLNGRSFFQKVEDYLIGKETGNTYSIELEAQDAYGKKDSNMIQLVPISAFKSREIMPYPGLVVDIDGSYGIVKTVSGGRILVDFNHPLSGRKITCLATPRRIVTDKKEQLDSVVSTMFGTKAETTVEGTNAEVTLTSALPQEISNALGEKLKELTGLTITFKVK